MHLIGYSWQVTTPNLHCLALALRGDELRKQVAPCKIRSACSKHAAPSGRVACLHNPHVQQEGLRLDRCADSQAVHFSQPPGNAKWRPHVQGLYRQAAQHALGAGLTALLSLSALRMPAEAGEILQGPASVSDGDTITVSSGFDCSSACVRSIVQSAKGTGSAEGSGGLCRWLTGRCACSALMLLRRSRCAGMGGSGNIPAVRALCCRQPYSSVQGWGCSTWRMGVRLLEGSQLPPGCLLMRLR